MDFKKGIDQSILERIGCPEQSRKKIMEMDEIKYLRYSIWISDYECTFLYQFVKEAVEIAEQRTNETVRTQ